MLVTASILFFKLYVMANAKVNVQKNATGRVGCMKKMKTGGTNNVNISKPGAGYAPRQVGGDNQKMNMYGIAQTGQGQMDGKTGVMKKGGMVKKIINESSNGKNG